MPPSVEALLFGAGAAVIAWALFQAAKLVPRLEAAGLSRRWRWLLLLVGLFVPAYLGAAALALAGKLESLSRLTSAVFLLGAVYVVFSVLLARSKTREHAAVTRELDESVARRAAQLEESNQKLEEAKDEAEETNRAKSRFLASMSHEIRTPLTAILGYTDLMLKSDLEERERLRHLQAIRRNGQHLLELINDVLDISKIEAGEMTVELLECSPWQLVREVRSLFRPQALAKGLAFEIEADGPLPEHIQSDPVRLRQILLNLVGNAIKFTETGGVRLTVRMEEAAALEGYVRLRFDVIDTGIGMTREEQGSVFKPFRQASASTTRVFGGTGLGLTISRRLARMLGGDITVRSVPGEGSTFSLTVDAGRLDDGKLLEGPLRTETTELSVAVTDKWWSRRIGGRILLAEDGVDNRRFISAVLQQVGAEVTLVENGRQAVDSILEARDLGQPFDAVLMDMQMPVLDGYEAVRLLREAGYQGRVVALTAYAMSGDREKCLAAGCDDFVSKPVDVEQFIAALARHVGSSGDGRGQDPSASGRETDGVPCDGADGSIVSTLAEHPTLSALVRGFVERLPKRLEELQSAFRSRDREKLLNLAHGLRGAGGTYGFKPLTEAAGTLEQRVREGAARAEIASALSRLTEICRRVSE